MRFNWDAIIPSVALMYDDKAIAPIKGTGFEIERGDQDGAFTVKLQILDQPTEQAEPSAEPTT
jgi:hypothetical protein